MTVIAGIAGTGAPAALGRHCRSALIAQRRFADVAQIELDVSDTAVIGGSRGGLAAQSGKANPNFRLVADIRLDNRADIMRSLGLPPAPRSKISDESLLLQAWSEWSEEAPTRIVGCYAFAVHDRSRQAIFLVRDAFGERPLNYAFRDGRLSFASMPSGVLPDEPLQPNLDVLAKQFRDRLLPPDQSNFHGVVRVSPGHIVEFRNGSVSSRRYWSPRPAPLPKLHQEVVEAFREVLDQSVEARLEDRSKPASSMLSSGFDSSSVTGTAARVLDDPALLTAYTSAPAFDKLLMPVSRFADETGIATESARILGIQHRIVRDKSPILGSIRGLSPYFEGPSPNPVNVGWWRKILDEVRLSGQSSLLVAVEGNFTVSYGGTFVLTSFLRQGRFLRWLQETRDIVRTHTHLRLRGALFSSFEGIMPLLAVRALQALFDRRAHVPELDFINPAFADPAPPPAVRLRGDLVKDRLALLTLHDNGERYKGMAALTGVEERDPTVDRRLVEFCLSLRPEHLLHNGEPRPLAREAFSDRMNPQVFNFAVRGIQSADLYCRLHQREAFEVLEEIRGTAAADLLDIPKLEAAINNWPAYEPNGYWTLVPFARAIWQSLNMGLFLAELETARPSS